MSIPGGGVFPEEPFHEFKDQWFSETDSGLLRVYCHERRETEGDDQRWNCKNKTGDRTGDSNFQQCRPVLDRGADLDESAHRSDERWSRNEIRKRRRYPIIAAREVVTHLVRKKDSP